MLIFYQNQAGFRLYNIIRLNFIILDYTVTHWAGKKWLLITTVFAFDDRSMFYSKPVSRDSDFVDNNKIWSINLPQVGSQSC